MAEQPEPPPELSAEQTAMAPVVVLEFIELIHDMGGAHYYATLGLWRQRKDLEEMIAAQPEIVDRSTWVMANSPEERPMRPYLHWATRELVYEKLGRDGAFSAQLSNAWIVGLVAAWEHKFRPELTQLLQLPEDLKCDVMGDLTLMRNDIVHHRAIATRKNAGRCRSLRWFNADQTIRVDTPKVYEFHQKITVLLGEWVRRAAELEYEAVGEIPPWQQG
jgi:hypothetical protein